VIWTWKNLVNVNADERDANAFVQIQMPNCGFFQDIQLDGDAVFMLIGLSLLIVLTMHWMNTKENQSKEDIFTSHF